MIIRRSFLPTLASLFLLVVPLVAHAETKILTAEATYTMGDGETPSFAEAMALQKAKQMALEQAGTYVESYTKIQNLDLTVEEIQTVAGGVLQVDVLEKKRSLVGDGLQLYVKIRAAVTTDKMQELAQRIRGKNVAEEYKKLKNDYVRLTRDFESWKQRLSKTPPGPEREVALDRIREHERAFGAIRKNEDALFQRLVSGEALVRSAQDERAVVDALLTNVVEQGHQLQVGAPTSHKTSGNHDNVKLRIPVTVRVNESIRLAMEEAALSLGGLARTTKFIRQFKDAERESQGTIIRMGKDAEVARYFRERVSRLGLVITLTVEDGQVLLCNDWRESENPRHMFYLETTPIVPVFGTYARHFIDSGFWGPVPGPQRDLAKDIKDGLIFGSSDNASVRWVGSEEVLFAGTLEPSGGGYSLYRWEPMPHPQVVVFEDVRNFIVTTMISMSQARQIKSIRGEYAEKQAEAFSPPANTPAAEEPSRKTERSWWERIFWIDEEKADLPAPAEAIKQQFPRIPKHLNCAMEQ